jgi:tRNA-dihydrouridine synthase
MMVQRLVLIIVFKLVNDTVNIPVIASGGAGSVQHFVDVFQQTNVDAALAASVFHYGEILIPDLKSVLRANNIEVRVNPIVMLNLFQQPTSYMQTPADKHILRCRNKFGMTLRIKNEYRF